MTRYPWLEDYLLTKPGAAAEFKIEWQWMRYLVGGKQFAAICTPGEAYGEYAGRTMVLLKCNPQLSDALRAEYPDIVPGFYSDKRHWNTVYLDGTLTDEMLRSLCDMSYQLVFDKLTKKMQREIIS